MKNIKHYIYIFRLIALIYNFYFFEDGHKS